MIMKAKSIAGYYIKSILTYSLFYFSSLLLVFIIAVCLDIVKEFFPIVPVFPDAVIVFLCLYVHALILTIWRIQRPDMRSFPGIFKDDLKWFDKLYLTPEDCISHEVVPKKLNDNFMTSTPIWCINNFSIPDPNEKFVVLECMSILCIISFIVVHEIFIILISMQGLFYYIMVLLYQQYMWNLLSKENKFYHDRMKALHRLLWLL